MTSNMIFRAGAYPRKKVSVFEWLKGGDVKNGEEKSQKESQEESQKESRKEEGQEEKEEKEIGNRRTKGYC
jgi:hypothetical protein